MMMTMAVNFINNKNNDNVNSDSNDNNVNNDNNKYDNNLPPYLITEMFIYRSLLN